MRANTIAGLAALLAVCFVLAPAARAEDECPTSACVTSQTTLTYDAQTHTMEAHTTAIVDYTSAAWYEICGNLDVQEVNGSNFNDWTDLTANQPPPGCFTNRFDEWRTVAVTPGRQYFAYGEAWLLALIPWTVYSPGCVYDCAGWYDPENFSHLASNPEGGSQPDGAPSICSSYPITVEVEEASAETIAMYGSGYYAWAPPEIDSVVPNQWPAGATTTVTITGVGFGYSPTLELSGGGATKTPYTCNSATPPSYSCDTQLVTAVTIPADAGATQVQITVAVGGQNGSGFLPIPNGGAGFAQAPATTTPSVAPVIMLGPVTSGTICSNGTPAPVSVNAVVGQRIAFGACIPSGVQPAGESWNPTTPSNAIAGWSPSAGGAAPPTAVSATACGTAAECDFAPFYFIKPDSYTFTFKYTPTNGQGQVSVSVTFVVSGPIGTGGNFFRYVPGDPVGVYPPGIGGDGSSSNPTLAYGTVDNPGIIFQVTATPPAGASGVFQWVQLVTTDNLSVVSRPPFPNGSIGTGLDGHYPYQILNGYPNFADDAPMFDLVNPTLAATGELARVFSAKMYLMWDPSLPGPEQQSCHAASTVATPPTPGYVVTQSNCSRSIPVPLGYMIWGFAGDAVNTLQNQGNKTTWVLMPCSGANPVNPAFTPSTEFPEWTSVTQ